MAKNYSYILCAFIFWGCASSEKTEFNQSNSDLSVRVHNEVLQELAFQKRQPAQSREFSQNHQLPSLVKIRPGKFEVYVFPKINRQNLKFTTSDQKELLGFPQTFQVRVVAENPCQNFITGKLFAGLNPQTAFGSVLADNPENRCAIVEIDWLNVMRMDRALREVDQVETKRLFLDQSYRVHSMDTVLYQKGKDKKTIRYQLNVSEASSSGLSLFPVDFPFESIFRSQSELTLSQKTVPALDRVALVQLKKLNKKFAFKDCEAVAYQYRDRFGGRQKVLWCKQLPWPSVIENDRFISVTQPLEIAN